MRRHFILWASLFLDLVLVSVGCSNTYRVVLKGPAFPARPMDCKVVFSDVDPDKAAAEYNQIGLISVDGYDGELTEGIEEEVRRRACKMGGEIVVPMGVDQGVEEFTTTFLVLNAKVGLTD